MSSTARRRSRLVRSLVAASVTFSVTALAPATAAAANRGAAVVPKTTTAVTTSLSPSTGGTRQAVPEGDEAITGFGDTNGYHLYAASSSAGWSWRPLATLQPGNYSDEGWTGNQCLTGDGRHVVVVVAPWHDVNGEAGVDHGGLAYSVDAHTGAVTPLAAGASLAYFNPACGVASTVALTSYAGRDESRTRISVLDAATGAVTASVVEGSELTSAVVVGGQIMAAAGVDLVEVTSHGLVRVAHLPGPAYQVHPSADGGVDMLSVADGDHADAWHWRNGRLTHLGSGARTSVGLFGGRGGHNLAVGLKAGSGDPASPAAPVRAVAAPGPVQSVSLDGGLAVRPGNVVAGHYRVPTVTQTGVSSARDLPSPAAHPTTASPRTVLAAATTDTTANTATPSCVVPRNDIFKQVPQPNSAQVLWAVNQAVHNWLSPAVNGVVARPVDASAYETSDVSDPFVPLTRGYPNSDFNDAIPGVSGAYVPPLVMYGILAQESNWSQASWHAAIGRTGNPLIANYYGDDANANSIDYDNADCGYGIGQVTDLMSASPPTPDDFQMRIVVDYATNIAAAVQILASKWDELHTDLGIPITLNDDDPSKVENWYAAIWAYNSGVHYGPGSSDEGLGWFNNPINPVWNPARHTFLHISAQQQTYGDASHPGDWPYQERVFGWMEVPLLDPYGNARYPASYDWSAASGQLLSYPAYGAFCDSSNNCDPSLNDPCPAVDSSCWWDKPVTWTDCTVSGACEPESTTGAPGDPEPAATSRYVPCDTQLPGPGAIVVDDEMIRVENPTRRTPNAMGCETADPYLTLPADPPAVPRGEFYVTDQTGGGITAAEAPDSVAAIDLHQIGAGIGGHAFFTHTRPASDAAREARGNWDATLPSHTVYEVKVYVPNLAAVGLAHYEIQAATREHPADRSPRYRRTINQNDYGNQWVSLGYYLSSLDDSTPGDITVTLRTVTPDADSSVGSDVAMDAVAFVPVPKGQYVALGDSYSSGEGVQGGWDDGTDVDQNLPGIATTSPITPTLADSGDLCHRSSLAYPRQYAFTVGVDVVHLACSGSNLWDLAGITYWWDQHGDTIDNDGRVLEQSDSPGDGWTSSATAPDGGGSGYYLEQVYQTDLLQALAPNRVTLTLGGNDMGFASIIHNCVQHAALSLGTLCQGDYQNASGPDKLDTRITWLQQPVTDALKKVIDAVGGDPSKVTLLTYPAQVRYDPYPVELNYDVDCSGLYNLDREWLLPKVGELDNMLAAAAGDASRLADPTGTRQIQILDERDAFAGHEACTSDSYITPPPSPSWVAANDPPTVSDNYFHPNDEGYQRLTNDLLAALPNP